MIADPLFYAVAIPAVLLTGISKGGFGSALGGIGVPLMALAISPVQAAAILLPVLCFMDLVGVRVYYGKWDKENLKIMIPGAMLGIAIGTLTFDMLTENAIRILIGGIAVAFPLNAWFGFGARQQPAGRSAIKGTFWSGVSGLTSFLAHAGGPPAMVYMLPQRLDKTTYVATISVFFMFVTRSSWCRTRGWASFPPPTWVPRWCWRRWCRSASGSACGCKTASTRCGSTGSHRRACSPPACS